MHEEFSKDKPRSSLHRFPFPKFACFEDLGPLRDSNQTIAFKDDR